MGIESRSTQSSADAAALFHAVLDTVGEGIITIDSTSTIIVVNQEVQTIWDYTQDELIGKNIEFLMPEKYREHHAAGLKRFIETRVPHIMGRRVELEGLRKDGSVFPLEIRMAETTVGDRLLFTAAVRDVTDRKTVEAALEQRNCIEDVISRISTKFINLPSNGMDEGIVDALRDIGELTGVDRSWVALLSEDQQTLRFTHEWSAVGITLTHSDLHPISVDTIPWAMEQFRGMETVYIPRVKDLPIEAKIERENFEAFDVQSAIMVPIIHRRTLMGIVSFDSVRAEKSWTTDDMSLLRITGEIFANALERKETEEAIECLMRKNELILASAGEGIYGVNCQGIMTFANPEAAALIGCSVDELVGKPQHAILNHTQLDGTPYSQEDCPIYKSFQDGFINRVEDDIFWRKDGTSFPVSFTSTPIWEDDKIVGAVVTFKDISERKRELEELESSVSLLHATLDSTTDGILVADREGCIVNFNKKFSEMWGLSSSLKISQNHTEAMTPVLDQLQDPEQYSQRLMDVYADPDAESRDVITFKDGRVFERYTQPQKVDGKSVGRVWSLRDVTARKRAEEVIQQAYSDLEQKVDERTKELRQKQAQLVQAEKMASLGQLVAGVAHEINTPLGALKSNIDILTRSLPKIKGQILDQNMSQSLPELPDLDKRLSILETLNTHNQTAIDRIVMIVNSLRKFARLDEAELDEVNIHEGLDNTLILVQHELKNRVEVIKNYETLPLIKCYPNQLNQVFMNLLVNASHAIEGQGKIFICTYCKNDLALVEIRDTGKGISKEDLPRIFDPGFTTKGVGVGTGLGLSIVYQILQDHKGTIEVESELGHGTTFRIHLPIL
ncbi:MAG: PAS domain S-box protein [Nitrospirales bacterium]